MYFDVPLNLTFNLHISCIFHCGSALIMVHSQEVRTFFETTPETSLNLGICHKLMTGWWPCIPQEEEAVEVEEVVQEREVVQEEELQEEDQEVIETWTRNVKACTCDCESADLPPTRTPAAFPPVLLTSMPPPPAPPGDQLLNCMPGEDTCSGTV